MAIDLDRILSLLPLAMAKPGSPQAAAIMQGYQESLERRRQEQLQTYQLATQAQLRQAQIGNLEADNARADEQMAMSRDQQALRRVQMSRQEGFGALEQLQQQPDALLPAGVDPLQAQNALVVDQLQAQQAYGVPAGTPQTPLPNMTALVSEAKKRRARKRYQEIVAGYGEAAAAGDSILETEGEFKGMKPSQIRALFTPPMMTAEGQPAPPYVPPAATSEGASDFDRSFQRLRRAQEVKQGRPLNEQELADLDTSVRQSVRTINRAPSDENEPLQAVMGPAGRPILVRRSHAEGMQPASSREQGRAVTSSDANRIAELDTSLDDVAVLRKTVTGIKGATGARAQAGAALPNVITEITGWGQAAKEKQAVIDRVKQVIGKALEGGVLRKEDEYKYVKILPTIGDTPQTVSTKIQGLEAAIALRRQRTLDALADAGYDIARFTQRSTQDAEYDYVPGQGLVPRRAR